MLKYPAKDWRKLGTRTFEAMLYGSGGRKIKKLTRVIYAEKTNHPRQPFYWFELKDGKWRITSLKGIQTGIVVASSEYRGLKEKLGEK